MHQVDFDLSTGELTKVEGAASLDLRVRGGKVEYAHFKILEYKRFFTKAMAEKPIVAIPQLLSRICGTCSNAHILCSIESCERALGMTPSEQTMLLRLLTMYGLNIRDHALHLYLFALPDIRGKDAFLDFDENDPEEHQMLHDAFEIKAAGNNLAILVAGRSVHAMHPIIGGFLHFPDEHGIYETIEKLKKIRPAALRLIAIFENNPFHFDRKTDFMALVPERFGFVNGVIKTSKGEIINESEFGEHLERTVLPYSQASAYTYEGTAYMVGALARMNLARERLHPETKRDAAFAIAKFPSTDIFMNNLAQAIEILHSIDDSLEILSRHKFVQEQPIKPIFREATGVGVVEAPRGTLYHQIKINDKGIVKGGEIVVPTGQNQINIEEDIKTLVESLLPANPSKEKIQFEIEKLIRAYDPCMSCAAHFLKINLQR